MLAARATRTVWALLTALQPACREARDDPDAAKQPTELEVFDTQLIGEPAPPDADKEADVVLLDPGAEPRRRLRYRLPPDFKQRITVTTSLVQHFEIDGNPLTKQSAVPTRLEVVLRNKPGDEPDGMRFDAEVVTAQSIDYSRLMVARGDQLVQHLDELEGTHIEVHISDRGIVDREALEATWSTNMTSEGAQIAGLWGTFTAAVQTALPEEEVGVGARWQVVMPDLMTDLSGEVDAAQELELVDIDGDRVELAESSSFELGEGRVAVLPSMKMATSASGRRTITLERIAPLAYESTSTTSMSWEIRDGPEVQHFEATLVVDIEEKGL